MKKTYYFTHIYATVSRLWLESVFHKDHRIARRHKRWKELHSDSFGVREMHTQFQRSFFVISSKGCCHICVEKLFVNRCNSYRDMRILEKLEKWCPQATSRYFSIICHKGSILSSLLCLVLQKHILVFCKTFSDIESKTCFYATQREASHPVFASHWELNRICKGQSDKFVTFAECCEAQLRHLW